MIIKIGYNKKLDNIIEKYGYIAKNIIDSKQIHNIILDLFITKCYKKNVAIWGVGKNNIINSHAAVIISKYTLNLKGLNYLIDSSKDLQGKVFMGYPIIAPEEIKEKKIDMVIIASRASGESIRNSLQEAAPQCEYLDIYEELRKQGIIIDYNFFSEQNIYTELYKVRKQYEEAMLLEEKEKYLHELIALYLKIRDFFYAEQFAREYEKYNFRDCEKVRKLFQEINKLQDEVKTITLNRKNDIAIHLIDSLRAVDCYERDKNGEVQLHGFKKYKKNAAILTQAYATGPTTYESMLGIVKGKLSFEENVYESNFMFEFHEFELLKVAKEKNMNITFYTAKDYLIMKEEERIRLKEHLHMSEKLWELACDMAESETETFNFLYYPWELHFPMLCGYLKNAPQIKHFSDVGIEDMSDFIGEQFTDCLRYVDQQFDYYKQYFSDDMIQVFFGDHSQTVFDSEKQLPFFSYYNDKEKSTHVAFIISSDKIKAGAYHELFSLLDFNSFIKAVLTEHEIKIPKRDIVQYQYYNIQNKKLRDVARQKGLLDYTEGIQCFLSNQYLYSITATGCEELYDWNGKKIDRKNEIEGNEFIQCIKQKFDLSFPNFWTIQIEKNK